MVYSDLQKLERQFGECFYLSDQGLFRKNLREMRDTFRRYYEKTNIAYSFKTNYMPAMCRIVREEAAYAEVVSEMEYELAKKIGFADCDIYYNGPYKKKQHVLDMLKSGVRINIDNWQEYEMVLEAAKEHPVQIGIRCNFDIGNGKISRFGFDVDGEEFYQVLEGIQREKNISLIGLQCHFPDRALDLYANRVKGMKRVMDVLEDVELHYISFGGGYFGKVPREFQKSFSVPVPGYEDYAKVVAGEMGEYFAQKNIQPELLIEPGSAIVADTMDFVSKVIAVKEVRGRAIAALSGSCYNVNPSAKGMNRPITVLHESDGEGDVRDWDMAGYTCIEDDIMYHGYRGALCVGDYVVFHNVGSYSVVFKPPFILPNVPVLDVSKEQVEVLKRGEEFQDIFGTFF